MKLAAFVGWLFLLSMMVACAKPRVPAGPSKPQPDPPPGICTASDIKKCGPK